MTDRVIRIIVDTGDGNRALVTLEDNLEGVERQEKRTTQSTNALGQAFRTLIAGLSLRELGRLADSYTTIQNRIRLVTDSQAELNNVQDEVFALAQRTRTDLTATADLYGRAARAVQDFGGSQADTLRFAEAVNQTLQISGATAAEAAGSTVQFAQGLAAGALRGEELNSVLEGNNRLARVLAKEFGVGIGQLRKLGEEGALTSDRIFKAVIEAGPELRAEFENITPTLEQTFTTLRNFGTLVVGSFNEAAGVTEGLNEIFSLTEEEAAELAATVRSLGLDFREFVEVATVAVVNFAETVAPRFGAVQAEIVKIIAALTRDEELFRAALEGQEEFEAEVDVIISRLDAEFEAIRRNNEERRKGLEERTVDLEAPGTGTGVAVAPGLTEEQEKAREAQEKLIRSLQQTAEATEIANRTGREYKEVLQELQIQELATAGGNAEFADSALELAGRLQKAREEAQLLAEEERQLLRDQERAAEITADVATETEKYAIALADLQDLLDRGLISPETFERAKDRLDELGSETEDFFRRARENSQDILAEFFAGGFDSLDDFARAFGDMLLDLTSQALAANVFDAIFGKAGAGGGGSNPFVDFFTGVFGGRQFGGGVQGGQAVNTGEGGRFGSEVFIPNVGGTVVPLGAGAGAGGSMAPPQVNLTNVSVLENSEIVGAFNDGSGDQVLLNRISVKRTAVRAALGI